MSCRAESRSSRQSRAVRDRDVRDSALLYSENLDESSNGAFRTVANVMRAVVASPNWKGHLNSFGIILALKLAAIVHSEFPFWRAGDNGLCHRTDRATAKLLNVARSDEKFQPSKATLVT